MVKTVTFPVWKKKKMRRLSPQEEDAIEKACYRKFAKSKRLQKKWGTKYRYASWIKAQESGLIQVCPHCGRW